MKNTQTHRHATLYPLDKATQAWAYGQRLTVLRRAAAQTLDTGAYLALHRKAQEVAGRLLVLLDSLTDAELLAWGADVTRQNFGGPVL
jgi:hypothetical protein